MPSGERHRHRVHLVGQRRSFGIAERTVHEHDEEAAPGSLRKSMVLFNVARARPYGRGAGSLQIQRLRLRLSKRISRSW
jgi:hypothetical protein